MGQEAIEAALQQENKAKCDPPLSEQEVLGIARSVSRYSPGAARSRSREKPWPDPLSDAAFQGLAGDIARTISPHSEADFAALLVQTLVAFGNIIDHSAYFRTEADHHYLNLFCNLVGRTSKGRKGTSWKHIRGLFRRVQEGWVTSCIQSGLSSGEGLIWAVRDEIVKGDKVSDEGVTDKRLLIVESEFASVLQVIQRDGNTLSATIRQAWDDGELRILTKKNPATATNAHISILGHITLEELVRNLDATEKANGFANRFLWILVKRSKLLPEGGRVPELEMERLVSSLAAAVLFANRISEIRRTQAARELWREVYPELSEGSTGLFGAVTSRGEAQVVRLSCLYALLDRSQVVDHAHLEAALALWKYSEDSVRYIFGDALGDPIADLILHSLRRVAPQGLTRTEISERLGRHKPAEQIGRALQVLAQRNLARRVEEKTEGRPIEHWFAIPSGEKSEISEELPTFSTASTTVQDQSTASGDISLNSHISPPGGERPDKSSLDSSVSEGERRSDTSLNSPISRPKAEFHPEDGEF
jgi:hypothetical protein